MEEPAYKPDPVRGVETPPATISLDGLAPAGDPFTGPLRLPGSSGGPPSNASCSPCSGRGLPSRDDRSPRWWALTPPLHPCPRVTAEAVFSLLPLREVAPAWLSPASCPSESGLSSALAQMSERRGRPAGSSASTVTPLDSGRR